MKLRKAKDVTKDDDAKKGGLGELISTVLWALGIALVLRTFLFQPFHIPSGSMLPGLMKGDYIITSKYSVGYGRHAATPFPFPVKSGRLFERELSAGDVIVFRPEGSNKNFIKRVIGLPGDQIQMIGGVLHLNGAAVGMKSLGTEDFKTSSGRTVTAEAFTETLPNGESYTVYDAQKGTPDDDTGIYTVPAGHYFMMGDNRDFSSDSRVPVGPNGTGGAGYVPMENIIGKAEIVLLSVNEDFSLKKPWTWANMRGDRFFELIE
jgi:signal peptidase I